MSKFWVFMLSSLPAQIFVIWLYGWLALDTIRDRRRARHAATEARAAIRTPHPSPTDTRTEGLPHSDDHKRRNRPARRRITLEGGNRQSHLTSNRRGTPPSPRGKNLTRIQLVAQLPSGIGDRTLLSYEHGARHLSVIRLIEIARVFEIPAPTLLTVALQRAQTELANLALKVDLQALLNDNNDKFRPMAQWAKNKLNKIPDGVAELPPSSIKELADFAGYTYQDLAGHLARFAPEEDFADGTNPPDTNTDSDVTV